MTTTAMSIANVRASTTASASPFITPSYSPNRADPIHQFAEECKRIDIRDWRRRAADIHNPSVTANRHKLDAHGHFDVLAGLDSGSRNELFARCRTRSVSKGKPVWTQAESAAYLVII